jgi:RNA polymerase sigma factor (sigma-70 family)
VRLPVHLNERVGKISRATAKLAARLNRMPTDAEICAEAGVSQAHLDGAKRAQNVSSPASLEASTAGPDEDDRSLIEVVADPTARDPLEELEASAAQALAASEVARLLARLPERQATVLRLRFGLDGHHTDRTLEQIGSLLGLTRERVRQIERDAMLELRRLLGGPQLAGAAD